jgi:hypothetical protein
MPHQTTLLNTLYVDTIKNRAGTADLLEGVSIKSSDITTGSKFLGANNDGSCSWQTPTNDAVPAPSTSGNLLTSDGTDWTSVAPSFQPGNAILTTIAELSPGTIGNVLTSDGTDWTSAALGSGSFQPLDADLTTIAGLTPGTSGNVLTSDGTTWTSAAVPAGTIVKHSVVRHAAASGAEVFFNIPTTTGALVDFGSSKTLQLTGVTATEGNLLLISTGGFSWNITADGTYSTNLNVRIDGTIGAGWGSNWMGNTGDPANSLTSVYFQTYYTVPASFTNKTIEFYAFQQTSNPATTNRFYLASFHSDVEAFVSVLEIQV